MKLRPVIDEIAGLIVRSCDPDTVVLFGSFAKDQANTQSDIDILVVGDFPSSSGLIARELQEVLFGLPIRIDVHVVTPGEVALAASHSHGFLGSVLSTGITLYTRNKNSTESVVGEASM